MEREFDDIVGAAAAGGEWAWSRLYRHYSGKLLGYLRLRGASEPEDALGEVWVQVARNIHDFEGSEANFRSWLFTIAHHRVIDQRRRDNRRPEVVQSDLPSVEAGNVEAEAMRALDREQVVELLGCLTEDQRNVLLLRIIGDQTIEQIADALGKRIGAVKALQRRGLAQLERRIQENFSRPVPLGDR